VERRPLNSARPDWWRRGMLCVRQRRSRWLRSWSSLTRRLRRRRVCTRSCVKLMTRPSRTRMMLSWRDEDRSSRASRSRFRQMTRLRLGLLPLRRRRNRRAGVLSMTSRPMKYEF
jgi:hypothetical protein